MSQELTVKRWIKFTGLILACQILRFRIFDYLPGDTVFSRIVKRSMFLSFVLQLLNQHQDVLIPNTQRFFIKFVKKLRPMWTFAH